MALLDTPNRRLEQLDFKKKMFIPASDGVMMQASRCASDSSGCESMNIYTSINIC